MKILKILFSILFVVSDFLGKSQQIQHYSQYFLNDYAMNSAIAGLEPYYQARVNNRYQWVGIVDAPKTFVLSLYGPDRKRDLGYGGYVFSDVTGPTSRTGLYGSYSYIMTIKGTKKLSMSLSAGLLQYKIDGSKITLHDEGDPSLGDAIYLAAIPLRLTMILMLSRLLCLNLCIRHPCKPISPFADFTKKRYGLVLVSEQWMPYRL